MVHESNGSQVTQRRNSHLWKLTLYPGSWKCENNTSWVSSQRCDQRSTTEVLPTSHTREITAFNWSLLLPVMLSRMARYWKLSNAVRFPSDPLVTSATIRRCYKCTHPHHQFSLFFSLMVGHERTLSTIGWSTGGVPGNVVSVRSCMVIENEPSFWRMWRGRFLGSPR